MAHLQQFLARLCAFTVLSSTYIVLVHALTRHHDQDNPLITYSGAWQNSSVNHEALGGLWKISFPSGGSRASFTFIGNSVSLWSPLWNTQSAGGWASIDGGPLKRIDLYHHGNPQPGSLEFLLEEGLDAALAHTLELSTSPGDTLSIDSISYNIPDRSDSTRTGATTVPRTTVQVGQGAAVTPTPTQATPTTSGTSLVGPSSTSESSSSSRTTTSFTSTVSGADPIHTPSDAESGPRESTSSSSNNTTSDTMSAASQSSLSPKARLIIILISVLAGFMALIGAIIALIYRRRLLKRKEWAKLTFQSSDTVERSESKVSNAPPTLMHWPPGESVEYVGLAPIQHGSAGWGRTRDSLNSGSPGIRESIYNEPPAPPPEYSEDPTEARVGPTAETRVEYSGESRKRRA